MSLPTPNWRQLLSKQPPSSFDGWREGQLQAYQPLPSPHAEWWLLLLSTSPSLSKPSSAPWWSSSLHTMHQEMWGRWWSHSPWGCSRNIYMLYRRTWFSEEKLVGGGQLDHMILEIFSCFGDFMSVLSASHTPVVSTTVPGGWIGLHQR